MVHSCVCGFATGSRILAREGCDALSPDGGARQGNGGRTHLVSPLMAAAAAVTGKLSDIRELELSELSPVRHCLVFSLPFFAKTVPFLVVLRRAGAARQWRRDRLSPQGPVR